jgi:hypothetical protein
MSGQMVELRRLDASGEFAVQMVKIQIPNQSNRAAAMLEVSRRGRVDCYPEHVYMVPEPALEVLEQLGVTYRELGRGGFDYAETTLRDALAVGIQRRPARRARKARKNP